MEVAVLAASFTFTNVIIKEMGIQQDPIQVCGFPFPVSLEQMLASVLVEDGSGNIGFRVTLISSENCDCTPVLNCDNNHTSPTSIIPLGFGLDDCGKLALKLIVCDGSNDERT